MTNPYPGSLGSLHRNDKNSPGSSRMYRGWSSNERINGWMKNFDRMTEETIIHTSYVLGSLGKGFLHERNSICKWKDRPKHGKLKEWQDTQVTWTKDVYRGRCKERRWKIRLRPATKSLKSSVNMFISTSWKKQKGKTDF